MAPSLEISRNDDRNVYLPPGAHVQGAAVAAIVGLGPGRQFTIGGNISILTGFVLAAFPMLYDAPTRPFDPYIHPNREMQNSQGILLPWSEDTPTLTTEMIDKVLKSALVLLYHVIRKPQNPMSQFTRRFNALYANVHPGIQPSTVDLDPSHDYKEAAAWLAYKGLDIVVLKFLLFAEDHPEMGPTGKAFIAQLRLVASFAEMTPYLTIKSFFGDGYTKGITLPGVGDEIGAFVDAEKMLKEHHSETMFPNCKVLRLAGHEALAPINFPNLCKVANTRKRKIDGMFQDYRSTKESLSNLTDKEVEEAVMHPPMKKKAMSSRDISSIKKLIPLTDEEIAAGYNDTEKDEATKAKDFDSAIKSLKDLTALLSQPTLASTGN